MHKKSERQLVMRS
jgi:Reverse transcriptase (RNA-dependent DNA polymerase)